MSMKVVYLHFLCASGVRKCAEGLHEFSNISIEECEFLCNSLYGNTCMEAYESLSEVGCESFIRSIIPAYIREFPNGNLIRREVGPTVEKSNSNVGVTLLEFLRGKCMAFIISIYPKCLLSELVASDILGELLLHYEGSGNIDFIRQWNPLAGIGPSSVSLNSGRKKILLELHREIDFTVLSSEKILQYEGLDDLVTSAYMLHVRKIIEELEFHDLVK